MRSIARQWLEAPRFDNNEEKTAQARLLNVMGLNFGLVLAIALIFYVPFFSNRKPESTGIILALMAMVGISRIFLFQRKLALASLFWIITLWILCLGLAFLSGGINSPLMFGLLSINLIVGLLVHQRYGIFILIFSLLLSLGMAILQQNGIALPLAINHSPLGIWFLFASSLVFIYLAVSFTVRRLENALALARKNEAARQQVEEALRLNEARFRMFMQYIPGLAYIKDASNHVLFASQGFTNHLGMDPDAMVGKTNLEIFGPGFGDKITQDDQQVIHSGGSRIIEEEFGGKVWSSYKFRIDQTGAPPLLGGITLDITERKQAEADLRKYAHIFEFAEWGIGVGSMGSITFELVNPTFAEMHGYTVEELVGQPVLSVFPPEIRDEALAQIRLSHEKGHHVYESVHMRKDGSCFPVLIDTTAVRDEQGALLYRVVNVQDITERKQAEDALRESQMRFSTIFQSSPNGIGISRLDGCYQDANEALCEMTGYTREEIIAHTSLDLNLWGVNQQREKMSQLLSTSSYARNLELRLRRKSGEILDVIANAELIELNGEQYVLTSLLDISERKKVEEAEREQRVLAEALINSASALNSTLNFNELLDRIMDNVGRVVPCDAVGVLLLDETGQVARVDGYRNKRDPLINLEGLQFPIVQTRNLREILATGAPVIIGDVMEYMGWIETPVKTWVHAHLGVPIKVKGKIIGFLCLENAMPNAFTSQDAGRLQAFVDHAALAIENTRLYAEVQKLALTDPLTGIYNRTFFEVELERLNLSRDFPVSIVVADLDNMKITNDSLGHLAGDELLKRTVQVLQAAFRSSDILARIGGDEFVVLLPATDAECVEQILSRIRDRLAQHNDDHPELPIQLSLGASTSLQGKLVETLIHADQRMYADKAARKGKL